MPVLVDTNILVRLSDSLSPHQRICSEILHPVQVERLELCCCAQVMIEYWAVATRPEEANGLGLSTAEARADLDEIRSLIPCLVEPPDIGDQLLQLAASHKVIGRQVHDARLVALMLHHDVRRIVTLNTDDFRRFSAVEAISPESLLLRT